MFESQSDAIFELLRSENDIDPVQLTALRDAKPAGKSLADAVVEQGLVTKPRLLAAIAGHVGCEFVAEAPLAVDAAVIRLMPATLACARGVFPLRGDDQSVDLLVANPFDLSWDSELTFVLGRDVRLLVSDPDRVQELIARYYVDDSRPAEGGRDRAPADVNEATAEPTARDLEAMAGQAPVVRLVNSVLSRAIRDRSSDVHFEPFEHEFKIRHRVDGTLHDLATPAKELALPVISRLKVLADLNIAERRVPQDGRIKLAVDGRAVDLRVSSLPTQFGESVVLRVLDQAAVQLDLTELGLPADIRNGIQQMIRRPHGIFLVTGPTGSGKTTTLYSGLRAINTPDLKLLTIEDPVEYEIEGVMQVPVNPTAGLSFASALRSFLRQDPDVIMVGEIRDLETAQIAIQASLTGHLVLSTLHTNDAPSAVTRLLDMGVEPFLLASTIEGVLAQRLVRRVCPYCRALYTPSTALLGQFGLTTGEATARAFFQGRGCDRCDGTGYRGRQGVFEWLPFSDTLREFVGRKAPAQLIRQQAEREGMRSLRDEGLRAVFEGLTTLEELGRHI